ncbi:MAG: hypothetical protein AAF639_44260 [Chloroflexota bacterium]
MTNDNSNQNELLQQYLQCVTQLEDAIADLSADILDKSLHEKSWTIRQQNDA